MEASKTIYKQHIDFVPHEGSILSNLRGYLSTSQGQALAGRLPTSHQSTSMDDDLARRSAGPFIDAIWTHIVNEFKLEANHLPVQEKNSVHTISGTVTTIARSILLIFVCRKSLSPKWFSNKSRQGLISSMVKTCVRLSKFSESRVQSYAKYWLDKILAAFMHDLNVYPPPPEGFEEPLLSGWCLRQVRRRLQRVDLEIAYSLQKGAKQVWPELPEENKLESLRDHRKNTCRDPASIDDAEMVKEIRSVSFEVFHSLEGFTKFCPRTTACSEFKCASGGNLSLVRRLLFDIRSLSDLGPNAPGETFFSERLSSTPFGLLRDLNAQILLWRRTEYTGLTNCAFFGGDELFLSENDPEAYRRRPLLDVQAIAIAEAAKFRIITKGAGRLYLALQPLQGAMLDAWKSHPTSTMLTDELTNRVQKLVDVAPSDFTLFGVVDYKSATDLVKREATLHSISGLTGDWATLAEYSFLPGKVDYGAFSKPEKVLDESGLPTEREQDPLVPRGDRKEGQLMGHPLSFPCLCVINLACYRRALHRWCDAPSWDDVELDRRQQLLSQLSDNVIINGDDMLFRCDKELYGYFCEEVTKVGFVFSAGKNYLSPDAALINSQLFRLKNGKISRVRYLNQRLLKGNASKTVGIQGALPTQIAGEVDRMTSVLPWTRCLTPLIFQRWKSFSRSSGWVPNWYLPVHLGGYGLPLVSAPSSLKLTMRQRQFASYLIRNPRLNAYQDDAEMIKLHCEELDFSRPKSAKWKKVIHCIPEPTMVSTPGKQGRSLWTERISLAYQYSKENSGTVSAEKCFRRWRKEMNVRPIGIHGLINNWTMGFVFPDEPVCPPLQELHCPVHVNLWRSRRNLPQEWLSFNQPWGHRE